MNKDQSNIFKKINRSLEIEDGELLKVIKALYHHLDHVTNSSLTYRDKIRSYQSVTHKPVRQEDITFLITDTSITDTSIDDSEVKTEDASRLTCTKTELATRRPVHKDILLPTTIESLAHDLNLKPSLLIGIDRFSINGINKSTQINKDDIEESDLLAYLLDKHNLIVTLKERPTPFIMTLLGHVDHGKTSLIDAIKRDRTIEDGGITQTISANVIQWDDQYAVMVDTPGHKAFNSLRSLGSQVCDMVLLIISCKDKVQPQTVEAIELIIRGELNCIVVITKIDLDEVKSNSVNTIAAQLSEHGLLVEELGGDVPIIKVSTIKEQTIKDLLSFIKLHREVTQITRTYLDHEGIILDKGIYNKKLGTGYLLLMRSGYITVGEHILFNDQPLKVKMIYDISNKTINRCDIYTPSVIYVSKNIELSHYNRIQKISRSAIRQHERKRAASTISHVTAPVHDERAINVIVRSATDGQLKALTSSLSTTVPEVQIISSGIGQVSSLELQLSKTCDAIVICYCLPAPSRVPSITSSIIYEIIESVQDHMKKIKDRWYQEALRGRFIVKYIFNIDGVVVLGGKVSLGYILLNDELNINKGSNTITIRSIQLKGREVTSAQESSNNYGISFSGTYVPKIDDILDISK